MLRWVIGFGRQAVMSEIRSGEVIDVRGEAGGPPYLVRWDDGHKGIRVPGPPKVEPRPPAERPPRASAHDADGVDTGRALCRRSILLPMIQLARHAQHEQATAAAAGAARLAG